MSEKQAGKLKAVELYSLLDRLREYIKSDDLVIKTRRTPPDSCGNIVHLCGEDFLAGFASFLGKMGLEAKELLAELSLIMELSNFVRNGGSRAIKYRLETGCFSFTPSYFDLLAAELICHDDSPNDPANASVRRPLKLNDPNLFSQIKDINQEDEARVAAAIVEIDDILLELSRRLEDESEAELARNAEPLKSSPENGSQKS